MTEHTLFESETETNRRAAATLLRDLADGVDAGQIQFSEGEESVTVEVASALAVEIEAERETDDEEGGPAEMEVEVELEWEEPDGAGEAGDAEAEPADAEESDGDAEGDESPETETDASEAERADVEGESDEEAEAETESETEGEPADAEAVGPDASVAAVMPGEDAPLASLGTFQVYRDRAEEWRWRLVHRNGNVIASSGEGYTTRRNAEKGMRSVMRNAPGAEVERSD